LGKIRCGTQSAQYVIGVRNPVVQSRLAERAGGHPNAAGFREVKAGRHYADERVAFAVQQIVFVDGLWIAAEYAMPDRIAD
jgi:hypothetical protein